MDLNPIKLIFSLMAFAVVVAGVLVNCVRDYTPSVVLNTYLYGKYSTKVKPAILNIGVPKSWFWHFYIFSGPLTTLALCMMVSVYFFSFSVPNFLITCLQFAGGRVQGAKVSAFASVLSMTLLSGHCWKRFYETGFINVFSKSKMDFSVYLVGFIHYLGAVLAILVEAPGFNKERSGEAYLSLNQMYLDLRPQDIAATLLFLWACHQQFLCALTLANLRKNTKGDVVTHKHSIPSGGLFDWVSAPHLLCEILMYISLTVILQGNFTWLFVFIWVLINQVATSLQTHWWYKEEFKDYPKKRFAVIPFLL